MSSISRITEIDGADGLSEALGHPVSVIYKHSPQCWISAVANWRMGRFARQNQDVPVYRVDVIYERHLSDEIATATSVRHASPQAIVLRAGAAVGNLTHFSINTKNLAQLVDIR